MPDPETPAATLKRKKHELIELEHDREILAQQIRKLELEQTEPLIAEVK